MSEARVKSGRTDHYTNHCFSWNSSDDKIHACIERNEFIKEIRSQLAKKKIKKLRNSSK